MQMQPIWGCSQAQLQKLLLFPGHCFLLPDLNSVKRCAARGGGGGGVTGEGDNTCLFRCANKTVAVVLCGGNLARWRLLFTSFVFE